MLLPSPQVQLFSRSHTTGVLLLAGDVCRILLRAPENLKDQKRYLQAVQKVIAYMTIGVDVSKLFSDMIMVSEGINGEAGRSSRDLHMHVT